MVRQIQHRRGTSAEWVSANPTLADGEFGYETDTKRMKIGNGITEWIPLAYSDAPLETSVKILAYVGM